MRYVLAAALLIAGGSGQAAQPADDGYSVVKQASAECAATTTWLILGHYYGGKPERVGEREYRNPRLPRICLGSSAGDCSKGRGEALAASEYRQWIELQRGGRSSPSLRHLGERLAQMRDPDTGATLFEVRGDYDSSKRREVAVREQRLREIRDLLDSGRPVVLHLVRPSLIPGHYVTLVGYEAAPHGTEYLFADTSYPEEGLARVSEQDLAGRKGWYRSSGWGARARWSGRYLSFWPR